MNASKDELFKNKQMERFYQVSMLDKPVDTSLKLGQDKRETGGVLGKGRWGIDQFIGV